MIKRKKQTLLGHLRAWSLILLFISFALTAVAVVYIPPLDAHWIILPKEGIDEFAYGIDIGLHDQWFFAWKREHVTVGIGDIDQFFDIPKFISELVTVSNTQSGTYLHVTGIVMTVIDLCIIAFAITVMCIKKPSYNLTKRYLILSSFVIVGITTLLVVAFAMKEAAVFGSMFSIEMNRNFSTNLWAAINKGENNPFPPVTCLDASYTQLGIALISFLAAYGGVCVGAAFYHYKDLKKKSLK